MEIIILSFFGILALVLAAISYKAKDPVLFFFPGFILIVLGLNLVVGGIDTQDGIMRNETVIDTNHTQITETYSYANKDDVIINGMGWIICLFGIYLLYVGGANTKSFNN